MGGVNLTAGAGALSAGVAGAASGAVTGGGKGALFGGFTGAAFAEVGNIFGHAVAGFGEKNFSWGNFAGRVAAHGTVGGLSSVASGGKFLSGFLSAGVSAAAGPIKIGGFAGGLVKSSVVGSFGSMLGGGKFQNGAITGAFQYLFNEAAQNSRTWNLKQKDFDESKWKYRATITADGESEYKFVSSYRIALRASSSSGPVATDQSEVSVFQREVDPVTGDYIPSIGPVEYFKAERTGVVTGGGEYFVLVAEARPNPTDNLTGERAWEWTVSIPAQESGHQNASHKTVEIWEQNLPDRSQ